MTWVHVCAHCAIRGTLCMDEREHLNVQERQREACAAPHSPAARPVSPSNLEGRMSCIQTSPSYLGGIRR